MTSVKGQDLLVELLGRSMDRIRRLVLEDERIELRPSGLRVLACVPADGASVTDLALELGMTKQGCGQFVTALVESGHLVDARDPDDARVRRVRRTPAGEQAIRDLAVLDAEVEAEWREVVGERRWATFRAVLQEVAGDGGGGRGV